jgi:hypothetical protein
MSHVDEGRALDESFRLVDDKAKGHALGSKDHDERSPRLAGHPPPLHLASTSQVDEGKSLDDSFWLVDDEGKRHALGSRRHGVPSPGQAFSFRAHDVRSRHDDVE